MRRYVKRHAPGQGIGSGLALHSQGLQLPAGYFRRIGGIIQVQPHAPFGKREAVAKGPGFGALAADEAAPQGITMACQASHVVEKAFPPAPAGFVAIIIHIEGHRLILGLKGHDFIVSGTLLGAGLHHYPKLHIIGAVEPAQITVQLVNIGNLPVLQPQAARDVAFFGMTIPRDGDLTRLALDKANLHHAFVDALGGSTAPQVMYPFSR